MVGLFDEEQTRGFIKHKLNSHDWWCLFPLNRSDILEDIEKSFYSGPANKDFIILLGPHIPGFSIALAKKVYMSPGMLAGKLGASNYSQFHDRDIIQFGEEGDDPLRALAQITAFSEWLGPID